jgi:hypothetical protein
MTGIDPELVRSVVRRVLAERFGGSARRPVSDASHWDIAPGPECSSDPDLPQHKPCLIEPHRLCYSSGYCRKLGY